VHATYQLGTLRLTAAGEVTGLDEAGARLLGWASPREALAAGTDALVSPAVRSAARSAAGNDRVGFVAECRSKSGEAVPCRFAVKESGAGEVVLLFAPVGEEGPGVRPAPARFVESLLDALPNAVFGKDEQHRWVLLNEAFCGMLGHPRGELLGKSDFDLFPEAQARIFWEKDEAVFATGRTNENEESLTDAAGRVHIILTRKSLHRGPQGRPLLLGVITDITERKQMEEELRRSRDELDHRVAERTVELEQALRQLAQEAEEQRLSELRFRQLADWMPQIVWTALPDGTVDYINARGPDLTAVKQEEGLGLRWVERVHPEDRSRVAAQWKRAVHDSSLYESEFRLQMRDGSYRWQLVRAVPIRDSRGNVVRWLGTATDIEEQKKTQRVIEDENQRKSDFLAILAHELRNPLTPIRNAALLLERSRAAGAAAQDRAVQIIERQVTQMARLIDDLLDLSRIARGKILLRKERLDVAAVVRTVVDDRREGIEKRQLSVETALPGSPVWLWADGARVAQTVGNLLDNAEKYSDPGGRIRVQVELVGGEVAIRVRDSGIGLSPEAKQHLFEPFVQARGALGRGGLGLGLSLVKSLAELHGGRVEAESEGAGRGATFTVWLPGADAPELAPAGAGPGASSPAPQSPAHRRILVIEDNADAAESLRMVLELEGHEVSVAATGEEGVAKARELKPEFVLSDIGLPGMSGYEVARALRADPALDSARLVAITGYGQVRDRELAQRSGFDAHLTKPFDPDALQRVLTSLETPPAR
jgi:PAS domain S-box-containing protein